MKTIRFLSISIVLVVSFVACSGKSDQAAPVNPVGPVIMASDGSNTIPAASLDQAVEYEPYVSDSLTVSFEGTKIRIFNTSGGTRLVGSKPWIWDIDWNMKAWNPDSTEVDLLAISNDPGWHPVKGYISSRLNFTIYCNPWPDLWWNGPGIGSNSGFGDEYLVGRRRVSRNGKNEDGSTYQGQKRGDTRGLDSCPVEDLNIRIQYPVFGAGWRNTDRDTWTLQHHEFPFPSETEIHPGYSVRIQYHPIVSDSSYIESETDWLNFLLEDRRTFEERLNMLPVWTYGKIGWTEDTTGKITTFWDIGGPLIVPPDTTTTGFREDDVLLRAVLKLHREYPHDVGFKGTTYRIRTGILSEKMAKNYGPARLASRGRGIIGKPWSVFLYERKRPFSFDQEVLAHEIGHNLNLIHTDEDLDYPGYASDLNKDAFLVEVPTVHALLKLDAFRTRPLMYSGFGNVRRQWLSEYNWNNILDFLDRETSSVSARVVAGRDQMWICNGQH